MAKYCICLIALFSFFNCYAQDSSGTKKLAIIHANIVNVISGKIEFDQTILIENGRISKTGSFKKTKVAEGTDTINAAGKYVMPGMTDAHIHFFQSGGLYTRPDGLNLNQVFPYEKDQQWVVDNRADLMARYLACGITTVIDVGGPFGNYAIRAKLDSTVFAPKAFVTGPLISTYLPMNLDKKDPPIVKVNSPQEARELVQKQVPYKPDFIKIWYIVFPGQKPEDNLPIIQATIEESHAHGLKVAVHATQYQTAKLAVTAGADILVHSVDDSVMDNEMLQLLKTKKTVYIPTVTVAENYSRVFTQQFEFSAHDLKYSNPFMLGTLMDIRHIPVEKGKMPFDFKKVTGRFPVPSKDDSIIAINLKKAEDAGILIAAGTDAGNIGTQHASSFFTELLAMKKAGLSNQTILRSATINAATGFGKEKDYGSIEKGKVADLLILDKNPIEDLYALADIFLVIHNGVSASPKKLLPVSPEILAQQQLNAYNARNIDAFLLPYHDSVEVYDFKGNLLLSGKEKFRESYEQFFKNVPELHCQLLNRMVQGNTVVDQESVTGFGNGMKAIAIYTIEGDKIKKVHFIQ